jgi:hypothetical protein
MDFSSFVNIDSFMQFRKQKCNHSKNSHNTLDFEVIGYKILTIKISLLLIKYFIFQIHIILNQVNLIL